MSKPKTPPLRSLPSLAGTAGAEHADVSVDKYGRVAFSLSDEEEDALAESIAEAERGEVITGEELLRRLRSRPGQA